MNPVEELRLRLEWAKGQRDMMVDRHKKAKIKLRETEAKIVDHEQATALFREVCQQTQIQIQDHLSNLVSMAMNAVFDEPYQLAVEFVQRRGKTECDLNFERDGIKLDPLAASGYGAVDVASFALRIAVWFLNGKQLQPVFILDEPFKHLKGLEENRRVLAMIKTLAETFGVQVLMVSDERIPREDIVSGADRVFEVVLHRGKSRVNQN